MPYSASYARRLAQEAQPHLTHEANARGIQIATDVWLECPKCEQRITTALWPHLTVNQAVRWLRSELADHLYHACAWNNPQTEGGSPYDQFRR